MLISPLNFSILGPSRQNSNETIVVCGAIGDFSDLPLCILHNGEFYSFACNKGCSDHHGNYFDYTLNKNPNEKNLKDALQWAEHCKYFENLAFDRQLVTLHKKIDELTASRLVVKEKQKEIGKKWDENIELINTKMGKSSISAKRSANHPFGGCHTSIV